MRLLLLTAALLAPCSQAQTVRVCTDSQPYPPLLMPDRSGQLDLAALQALQRVGLQPVFSNAPRTRCRKLLEAGMQDAMIGVAYLAKHSGDLQFPMRAGGIDEARALGRGSMRVFRRIGSPASWDGRAFSGLRQPVLSSFGLALTASRLRELGVPFDDQAKSTRANFMKLLSGRAELSVALAEDGLALLDEAEFKGNIEMLPAVFYEAAFYLVFSKSYYARHGALLERSWDGLRSAAKRPTLP